jgi:hypothetical protein
MGAVDGEDLELLTCNTPHPAGSVHGLTIGGHYVRIAKSSQPRLALRKLVNATERDPREIAVRAPARNRGKQKANYRYGHHHRRESVEQDSELHEEAASGKRILSRRGNHRLSRHFHFSKCCA